MKIPSFLLLGLAVILCSHAHAGSATWNANPTTNLWNTPNNWTPATVPNGETDIATFSISNITDVMLGGATNLQDRETDLAAIVFSPGPSAYTLTAMAGSFTIYAELIVLDGDGIVNNSGTVQNIVVGAVAGPDAGDSGELFFDNASSAGDNIVITNQGGGSSMGNPYGGWTAFALGFTGTASAENATFVNEGGKVSGTIYGGATELYAYSTAEAATFINQPGVVAGAAAGHTFLYTGGNIGSSTFLNNTAIVTGAEGGWTELDIGICNGASFIANGTTSAGPQGGQVYTFGGSGYATFTAKGGQGSGAQGGLIAINNMPNSSQTLVTAEAGINGGLGGVIELNVTPSSLDQVQFQLLGNGIMDLSGLLQNAVTIGSLSGQGSVLLSSFILNIGSNNLSTTFSGVIQDNGSINKVGTGTLTLTGANSYSHGTTVSAGTLLIGNRSGSGTGSGPVKVNADTLGGKGIITGAVTIGMGNGAGAVLAPSAGTNQVATLSVNSKLTCKADSSYSYKLNTKNARADQIIARGVTIQSGAQLNFQAVANRRLASGTVFTAISNTSANPIVGIFANLPDGSDIHCRS